MPINLELSDKQHESLTSHLRHHDAKVEQVAFAFCRIEERSSDLRFVASELYMVPPSDFAIQESYHIALTDDGLARIIKAAWEKHLCLAEFHSHLDLGLRTKFLRATSTD